MTSDNDLVCDIFVLTLHLRDLNGILRADLTVDKSGLHRANKNKNSNSTHTERERTLMNITHTIHLCATFFQRVPVSVQQQVSLGNVILEIMKLSLEICR